MNFRVLRYLVFLAVLAGVHAWLFVTGRPGPSQAVRLYTLHAHEGPAWSVAFSPRGDLLATAGQDHLARLWRLSTGRLWRTFRGDTDAVGSLAFSPDGRTLATGSADGTVKLWDVASGRLRRTLSRAGGPLAFSPDGRLLVSDGKCGVAIWDARAWKVVATLPSAGVPPGAGSDSGRITQVAFAPDGRSLATVESVQSGSGPSPPADFVQIWDTATWRVRRSLHEPSWEQKSIAFAPDSRRLAIAGGWILRGDVLLWNFAAGRARSLASGLESQASSIVYDPRGRWVAFALGGDASFVDASSGREILAIRPKGSFQQIAVSPDGALLAATEGGLLYANGVVEMWRLPADLEGASAPAAANPPAGAPRADAAP